MVLGWRSGFADVLFPGIAAPHCERGGGGAPLLVPESLRGAGKFERGRLQWSRLSCKTSHADAFGLLYNLGEELFLGVETQHEVRRGSLRPGLS